MERGHEPSSDLEGYLRATFGALAGTFVALAAATLWAIGIEVNTGSVFSNLVAGYVIGFLVLTAGSVGGCIGCFVALKVGHQQRSLLTALILAGLLVCAQLLLTKLKLLVMLPLSPALLALLARHVMVRGKTVRISRTRR